MRFAMILAAASLIVDASDAATITYSFDSAQSRLNGSGNVRNIAMSPQETNSMSGVFGGTLRAQWRDAGLTFSGGSSIVSLPHPAGPFVPSAADAGSGSMVDNFGVEGRVLGVRVLSAAVRDTVADILSGQVDYGGPVTALRFGFVDGTVDYEDHFSDELSFINLNELEPVLNTANGSLTRTVQNKLDTITLPIFVDLQFEVFEPDDSRLRLEGQLVATSPVLTIGPSETTTISSPQHLAGLNLEAGATLRLASSTLVTRALDIGGGAMPNATLDVGSVATAVVIDYPTAGPSPATAVRQQIIAGRGNTDLIGAWDGMGITSGPARDDPATFSVGWGVNGELPLGPYASFRGEPVDPTSVLIRATRIGDANLDGVVNDNDVTIVGATFGMTSGATWALGDFDYDGDVDDNDVTLIGALYDPAAVPLGGVAGSQAAPPVTAIPEPASWLLMALAGLFVFRLCR